MEATPPQPHDPSPYLNPPVPTTALYSPASILIGCARTCWCGGRAPRFPLVARVQPGEGSRFEFRALGADWLPCDGGAEPAGEGADGSGGGSVQQPGALPAPRGPAPSSSGAVSLPRSYETPRRGCSLKYPGRPWDKPHRSGFSAVFPSLRNDRSGSLRQCPRGTSGAPPSVLAGAPSGGCAPAQSVQHGSPFSRAIDGRGGIQKARSDWPADKYL